MAKHKDGLDPDGDSKRCEDEDDGKKLRGREFMELQSAFEDACARLPPEYAHVARDSLQTMAEHGRKQFNADQGNRMMESIESSISDLSTGQQAEMAEINDLMSKRSNMIEMTKNIATALNGQQEFISRNSPR